MTPNHTATPWVYEENCVYRLNDKGVNHFWANVCTAGKLEEIASKEECEANAAYIVKACNSHHDLLEALEEARKIIADIDDACLDCNCHWRFDEEAIDAAISKAKGESE